MTSKRIYFITAAVAVVFFCLSSPVYATSLTNVGQATGTSVSYSGSESNLSIHQISSGAYEIKANTLSCNPITTGCDPDRYEIQLSDNKEHVFGTGMQSIVNQAELDDFQDNDFSFGHCESVGGGRDLSFWQGGACRMRTPIFIIPEFNLLIVYLQPYPKVLRLSRNNQSGCPVGKTCIVLKLKSGESNAGPAPLVIIKKSNLDDVYQAYKNIKNKLGYTDKQPAFSIFGSNWETFSELHCIVNKGSVEDLVNRFLTYGPLSTVTVGSGYWSGGMPGCGYPVGIAATTDSLQVDQGRWGGLSGITDYYENFLRSKNIVPMIGMRHRVSQGDVAESNVQRIINLFNKPPISVLTNLFISQNPADIASRWLFKNDTDDKFYMLRNISTIIDGWLSLIKTSYGNFGGIKHDDMIVNDQKDFTNNPKAVNLPDDYYNNILDRYVNRYGNQFVILTRNTWVAMKGDAIVPDQLGEYGPQQRINYPGTMNLYSMKYQFDNAITTAVSGYPTIQNWTYTVDHTQWASCPNCDENMRFLRSTELSVFQGVTMFSLGFWHTTDASFENALKFYLQLRDRLHQYAFDQAMDSYTTGTLMSLRPLFFDYPTDPEVYTQYSQPTTATDVDNPRNEFMFGNALLIRPIFSEGNTFKVYLPDGVWRPFLPAGQPSVHGKTYIDYSIANMNDYPVFLKEGEILLIADPNNYSSLNAYVFLESLNQSSIYTFHDASGKTVQLQASKDTDGNVIIKNLDNLQSVSMQNDIYGKGFKVATITALLSGDTVPTVSPTPTPIPGDISGPNGKPDGKVDIQDYNQLVTDFGKTGTPGWIAADINKDGKVDIFDYNVLVGNFGK